MKALSNHRWLGASILAWTLLAWGGRIGLLAEGDDNWDKVRIGVSMAVGLAVFLVLWLRRLDQWATPILYAFGGWTILIWARSLIINWSGSGSLPFKLVHTLLGAGFLALAWWALAFARRRSVARPDEGHG